MGKSYLIHKPSVFTLLPYYWSFQVMQLCNSKFQFPLQYIVFQVLGFQLAHQSIKIKRFSPLPNSRSQECFLTSRSLLVHPSLCQYKTHKYLLSSPLRLALEREIKHTEARKDVQHKLHRSKDKRCIMVHTCYVDWTPFLL